MASGGELFLARRFSFCIILKKKEFYDRIDLHGRGSPAFCGAASPPPAGRASQLRHTPILKISFSFFVDSFNTLRADFLFFAINFFGLQIWVEAAFCRNIRMASRN